MYFFQVPPPSLLDIFRDEDEEASALFESCKNMVAIYNKKLSTTRKTKEMMKAPLPVDEFKNWETKFADREAASA